MISDDKKVEIFRQHRSRLFGIAYRMLGTHAEAEDILQEAYIRWHKVDLAEIETPEAWLVTIVTRLSIDRLRKASRERETYIGPWLPEPLRTSDEPSPEEVAEFASDLSLAFLVLLERLSPVERAVFLLHDIFDCAYADIARITGKTEAASRQIVHRSRKRVRSDKPRFETDEKERVNLINKFVAATRAGDEKTLLSLFADEISATADSGGKVNAARKTIYDKNRLARLFSVAGAESGGILEDRLVQVNGETGLLTLADGKPLAVITFEFENGKITALYSVMNPDKLKAFEKLTE